MASNMSSYVRMYVLTMLRAQTDTQRQIDRDLLSSSRVLQHDDSDRGGVIIRCCQGTVSPFDFGFMGPL